MQGVYEIRNTVTGDCYIGKSKIIEKRWLQHIHELEEGCHVSQRFQSDWMTYGPNAFAFKVLEIIPNAKQCGMRETALIDMSRPTYNIRGTEYEVDLRRERELRVKTERLRIAVTYLPQLYNSRCDTFTVTQASYYLGCASTAITRLCDNGIFPGMRRVPGKGSQLVRRIPREDIIAYIENERQALAKQLSTQ